MRVQSSLDTFCRTWTLWKHKQRSEVSNSDPGSGALDWIFSKDVCDDRERVRNPRVRKNTSDNRMRAFWEVL